MHWYYVYNTIMQENKGLEDKHNEKYLFAHALFWRVTLTKTAIYVENRSEYTKFFFFCIQYSARVNLECSDVWLNSEFGCRLKKKKIQRAFPSKHEIQCNLPVLPCPDRVSPSWGRSGEYVLESGAPKISFGRMLCMEEVRYTKREHTSTHTPHTARERERQRVSDGFFLHVGMVTLRRGKKEGGTFDFQPSLSWKNPQKMQQHLQTWRGPDNIDSFPRAQQRQSTEKCYKWSSGDIGGGSWEAPQQPSLWHTRWCDTRCKRWRMSVSESARRSCFWCVGRMERQPAYVSHCAWLVECTMPKGEVTDVVGRRRRDEVNFSEEKERGHALVKARWERAWIGMRHALKPPQNDKSSERPASVRSTVIQRNFIHFLQGGDF